MFFSLKNGYNAFHTIMQNLSVAYQSGVALKTKEKLFNIMYLAGLFKHLGGVF